MSPAEPAVKRAIVFIDGQNLFHATREVFGYMYPNYDVQALARRLCAAQGWQLEQTRFERVIELATDSLAGLPADSVYRHFGAITLPSVYAPSGVVIRTTSAEEM